MADPFVVALEVWNEAARKAADAQQARPGERPTYPGWLVAGLFLPAADGQLTCIDYRVRAIPNLHDIGYLATKNALADAMTDQHVHLPAPTVTPGGIPRYVFERASQVQLLKAARETVPGSAYHQQHLSQQVQEWLGRDGRKRTGRPPARSLREKLLILESVGIANEEGTSLDEVAEQWHMSRSSLRNLLFWARHTTPLMFIHVGAGNRGGTLTDEARALLDEIRGAE